MLIKLLKLFFNRKGRISKSDSFFSSLIWFAMFFIVLNSIIGSIISITLSGLGINIIFLVVFSVIFFSLLYSGYCLKRKRLQDIGFSGSIFGLKSQFKVFEEGSEVENLHGKREEIFNIGKKSKILIGGLMLMLIFLAPIIPMIPMIPIIFQ